jgi:hypothetical protein
MSLTIDGSTLFGTGPAVVTPGPVLRQYRDALYPGLVGQTRLHLRGDVRKLVQTGLLVASSTTLALACTALYELINVIEGHDIGATTPLCMGTHVLIDDDGVTWSNLTLDTVELTDRVIYVQTGASAWTARAPYRAVWTQLNPEEPEE